jgi:hypothetical protein
MQTPWSEARCSGRRPVSPPAVFRIISRFFGSHAACTCRALPPVAVETAVLDALCHDLHARHAVSEAHRPRPDCRPTYAAVVPWEMSLTVTTIRDSNHAIPRRWSRCTRDVLTMRSQCTLRGRRMLVPFVIVAQVWHSGHPIASVASWMENLHPTGVICTGWNRTEMLTWAVRSPRSLKESHRSEEATWPNTGSIP